MSRSMGQGNETRMAESWQSGDAKAIGELLGTYLDRLYSLIFYEVGGNKHVAEDITQETFLSALKSAKKFRSESKPYTWLVGIAHHKVADYYRRQSRASKHEEQRATSDTNELEQIPDSDTPVVNMIESQETLIVIEQALSCLPPDYRQVLLLKYVEEMPVAEISQVVGRSQKSVEGLLTRARKAFRASLTVR